MNRPHLTREGWLWLAAAVGFTLTGWAKGINLILVLGYLLLGALFLNYRLARPRFRTLVARRRWPSPVIAGEPATWTLDVAGIDGPMAGWTLDDVGALHRVVRPLAAGSGRSTVTIGLRGLYRLEPLLLRGGFPFGLVESRTPIGRAEELTVLPALGRVDGEALRRHLRASASDGDSPARPRPHRPAGREFQGLRAYRTGDSPRLIHWRTSARRGEWMIREFDAGGRAALAVIVDLRSGPALEPAIALAASLIWHAVRRDNTPVALAALTAEPWVERANADPVLMLERLAREPGCERPDEIALAALWRAYPPAGATLLISARLDPADVAASLGRPLTQIDPTLGHDFYTPAGR